MKTTFHYTVALCEDSRVLLIGSQCLTPAAGDLAMQSAPRRVKIAPWLRESRAKVTHAPYKLTLRDHRSSPHVL
jgi:hypothetical protein